MKCRVLSLLVLKGLSISLLRKCLHVYLLVSYPFLTTLNNLFSRKMRRLYSIGLTFFILKFNIKHMFWFFKLLDPRHRQLYHLRQAIRKTNTSQEWRKLAQTYEQTNKKLFGPARGMDVVYDKDLIKKKKLQMSSHNKENMRDFMNSIRLDLTRNIGNIAKNNLHDHFLFIPDTILNYIAKVKEQLTIIKESSIPQDEKLKFFLETRHSYGRTALLMSGGASLGTFHMGIAKALFEHGLLPRIIAGTSVGSIIASIICIRTNEELAVVFQHLDKFDMGFFSEHTTINLVRHFIEKGHFQDDKHLIQKLKETLGDYTFQEAYERTGRVLNVTVCPAETNETPRVLNFLTAPNVLIWSAVAASSAMPGLFPSQVIYTKSTQGLDLVPTDNIADQYGRKWQDGSLQMDLPVHTLTEQFNCNYFIVSQCNPHILPALNIKKFMSPIFFNLLESEFKHRCRQLQFILPKWVPSKWLNLFTQTWIGDVTFLLPIMFYNPTRLITNPDLEQLIQSVKMGERQAWEHLWVIECNCAIESFLDDIVKEFSGSELSWGLDAENVNSKTYDRPVCSTATLVKVRSLNKLYNDHLDFIDP